MGLLSEKEQRAEMSRTYDARTLARNARVEELQSVITECPICKQAKHWVSNTYEAEFEINPAPELKPHANAPLCEIVMNLRDQMQHDVRKVNELIVHNANTLAKRIDDLDRHSAEQTRRIDALYDANDVITGEDWNDAMKAIGENNEKIVQLSEGIAKTGQMLQDTLASRIDFIAKTQADANARVVALEEKLRSRGLRGLLRRVALKAAEVLA